MENEVAEINLGKRSAEGLVANIVTALGYRELQSRSLHGQSGLCHDFQSIAVRDKKVLLIVGGAETDSARHGGYRRHKNNAERSEAWIRDSLTKYYDVAEAIRTAGYQANALLFQNVNDRFPKELMVEVIRSKKPHRKTVIDLGLPDDSIASFTMSVDPLPNFLSSEVTRIAQNMGFPYFALSDIDYQQLKGLVEKNDRAAQQVASVLKDRGLYQYFYPAVDEYVLSCLDRGHFSPRDSKLEHLVELGEASGAEFQDPVHISTLSLRDPLQIAKELATSKTISFESEITVTEKGRTIRQKISSTPQESFVSKVLKCISLQSVISIAVGGSEKK